MSDTSNWFSAGTDEPLDKQRDLTVPGHFAVIGPEYPDGYGWTVVLADGTDSTDVASGESANETTAMSAVEDWERVNQP
jgi:hypothetical protein